MNPAKSLLPWGRALQFIGLITAVVGAVGLIIAAALPWAMLTFLNQPIDIPGFLSVGGVTAAIGLLGLAQIGGIRRFPLIGVVLGVAAFLIGQRADTEAGAVVVRNLLRAEVTLAPINARLAQVNLPPIEPFGPVVGSRRDHTGIGPLYTEYGGVALAAGSLVLLAGGRIRRTCRFCKRAWSIRHGDQVAFCPYCGKHSGPMRTCPRCAATVGRRERHCVRCGENLPAIGNKIPRLQP